MIMPLPNNLQTYQDWIDDAVRFYPEWVLLSAAAVLKNPNSKDSHQDLWRSIGGLYLAAARLREIGSPLTSLWPDAKEGIQNLKKLASKIDDLAGVVVAGLSAYQSEKQKAQTFKRIAALVTLYLNEAEPLRGYMKPINVKGLRF